MSQEDDDEDDNVSRNDELVLKRLFAALGNTNSYNIKCPDELIVVFRWGSRLWGTATHSSDNDLVIIHTSSSSSSFGATVCAGIDVKAMSAFHFEESILAEHDVFMWLPLLLPVNKRAMLFCNEQKFLALKSKILKSASAAGTSNNNGANGFSPTAIIKIDCMMNKLAQTLKQDEARATKNAEGGAAKKAQKIVLHSYRLVRAVELVMEAAGMSAKNRAPNASDDDQVDDDTRGSSAAAAAVTASSPTRQKQQRQHGKSDIVAVGVHTVIDMDHLRALQDGVHDFWNGLAEQDSSDDYAAIYHALTTLASTYFS